MSFKVDMWVWVHVGDLRAEVFSAVSLWIRKPAKCRKCKWFLMFADVHVTCNLLWFFSTGKLCVETNKKWSRKCVQIDCHHVLVLTSILSNVTIHTDSTGSIRFFKLFVSFLSVSVSKLSPQEAFKSHKSPAVYMFLTY